MRMRDDRFWPRDIAVVEDKPSLLNEPVVSRDTGAATVLHRRPNIPLRAILGDCLAQTEALLAQLEGGVHVPNDVCRTEYEATIRQLYLRSQDQVRVLRDALELEGLE